MSTELKKRMQPQPTGREFELWIRSGHARRGKAVITTIHDEVDGLIPQCPCLPTIPAVELPGSEWAMAQCVD